MRSSLWCPADGSYRRGVDDATALILLRCAERGRTVWSWSTQDWVSLIGNNARKFTETAPGWAEGTARSYLIAYAYLISEFTEFAQLGRFQRLPMAWRVFGRALVDEAQQQVADVLRGWGYQIDVGVDSRISPVLCNVLLHNRSPLLKDLTTEAFARMRQHPDMTEHHLGALYGIQRAVAALGHCALPPDPHRGRMPAIEGTASSWAEWVERWHTTCTLSRKARDNHRIVLSKIGRWLAAEHPEITEPAQWTRQTCAAWVAAVDKLRVGDYVQRRSSHEKRIGQPITPHTKAGYLTAARAFFRDLQEWEWIPRRFDPERAMATPRTTAAMLGPDPRVIADEIWAKLLWAGLNIEPDDLPTGLNTLRYPLEHLRAVSLTWLFSGLRSDEIARLRIGCIRWQHDGFPIPGDSREVLARDAVCLLDVPTHKTGIAFTKPVDPLLGQAIEAWQAARPEQPTFPDRKTGQPVHLLFALRARAMANTYINATIIPSLCRKAGVPTADVRGAITSHRARSTIASQLYNAKEPMTLFELQAWLGHGSPHSTQHYAKITPNTLAKAYNDAGYFARNVRTIEVLVDRDAVTSGAAAAGEPWQYYDMGHGYCTYSFFEQCQHRMACAKCDFYTPKDSTKGQLLEAKDNLQRMLASIPLTDDERAAVDDGQAALDQLLERLIDIPTPTGATPRQIGLPTTATLLPIIAVNQAKRQLT
ncbi:tyrosine-type recombinase/integrase [Actinospica durhamensis]|uniref:Tyrosine-type recombinase/integrase n=1 Tax=Actinospica durhamensis TaxID=1508375 RepID=A0A941IS34_9ACTN|nr:tyrosine-type recombinase/integrase [Actinospica durhamensis]MBR7839490.1 tyrosine-type recombinase/integrase [Actinospica durhamensis]